MNRRQALAVMAGAVGSAGFAWAASPPRDMRDISFYDEVSKSWVKVKVSDDYCVAKINDFQILTPQYLIRIKGTKQEQVFTRVMQGGIVSSWAQYMAEQDRLTRKAYFYSRQNLEEAISRGLIPEEHIEFYRQCIGSEKQDGFEVRANLTLSPSSGGSVYIGIFFEEDLKPTDLRNLYTTKTYKKL